MHPKDLVVFLEEACPYERRLAVAAGLAARWDAHLIAVFAAVRLGGLPLEDAAAGAAVRALLESHRERVRSAEARTRAAFEEAVSRHSIRAEWRFSEDESADELMLHARYARLALVPPFQAAPETSRPVIKAVHVIFDSGRPTLLVPDDWPSERIGQRIVVGWNASREATRAVDDALPFLAEAEAVQVVCVAERAASAGPGGREVPGADLCRHLARHGVPVALEQIEDGKAGTVLLECVRAFRADMLVMGAYGHSSFARLVLGSATRTVLAAARVPVLLSR